MYKKTNLMQNNDKIKIGGNIMKWLDYLLLALGIIGCINWGLVGFFRFDLVAFLFGDMSWFSRIIFALVGLSGLYMLSFFGRIRSAMD